MDPAPNPLSEGVKTSEHAKITDASTAANVGMIVSAIAPVIALLKDAALPPSVELAIVGAGALLFGLCFLAKIWVNRQYSKDRTAIKIAAIQAGQPAATVAKLLALILLPFALIGCASDARITTARDAAAKYEDTAIQQHMAVHATEQQALFNAQASDIAFKTKLNVDGAVAAAKANPQITPDKLAADISRSYQEQQILLNQVNANISNLQQQIAGINAYHTAAQQIFTALDQYDAVPTVTATGVATATTQALSGVIKPKTAAATVPAPTSSTPPATGAGTAATPATVALPVPNP